MSPRAVRAIALAALLISACAGSSVPSDGATASAAPTATGSASGPPASDAFTAALEGSWRPAAYPVPAGALDDVDAACRAADPALEKLQPLLRDVRGTGRATVLFADGGTAWECRAHMDATVEATAVELDDVPAEPIADDAIDVRRYEVVDESGGGSRTVLIGRVGRQAFRVTAVFDDQSEVDASIGGGWYAMWWPGEVKAATVAAVDRRSMVIDGQHP